MIILMSPNPAQQARLTASEMAPLWFAAPILNATDTVRFSRSVKDCVAAGVSPKSREAVLVFNIGLLEAVLGLLPTPKLDICSLYQWVPLDRLPLKKRLCYNRVLGKSRVILTYSRLAETDLSARFPDTPVKWIGLFTDTAFFNPAGLPSPSDEFILCPGDHKRIESVVTKIATALKVKVVRFATDPKVAAYYEQNPCPYVTCVTNVPFVEVRRLYQAAKLVINVADDRFWPVGITTFCEALAMNKPVVTPGGHSSSGYCFADGYRPYWTVKNAFDADEWVSVVGKALQAGLAWPENKSPRELALKLCSFDTQTTVWKNVLTSLS